MLSFKYLSSRMITAGFGLFWLAFWLFNGLDKFLNRSEVGALTWFGKDRTWQFGVYLENMGLSQEFIPGILTFAGVWELAVAAIFIVGLNILFVAGKSEQSKSDAFYKFGLFASMITFIGFCIFDVIVGDRAELLEHSTYMIVVAVSFIGSAVEQMVSQQVEIESSLQDKVEKTNPELAPDFSGNGSIILGHAKPIK